MTGYSVPYFHGYLMAQLLTIATIYHIKLIHGGEFMDKFRDGKELENGILIFDVPEEKGIELIIPVFENMRVSVFLSDDEAVKVIRIIQNKLNGRL